MNDENQNQDEADRPRVLDYAGDRFIRPRFDRVATFVFAIMLPIFFISGMTLTVLLGDADLQRYGPLRFCISKFAVALIWSASMLAVFYVPNRARRWQITEKALIVLNGEVERTVVPWDEVHQVRGKLFGLVVRADGRRRFVLPGAVVSDSQVVEQYWRDGKSIRS